MTVSLSHLHARVSEDGLHIIRCSTRIEQQGCESVAQVMNAKVSSVQSGSQLAPIDRSTHVGGIEPATSRSTEHQIFSSLTRKGSLKMRDECGGNRHSSFFVALGRHCEHLPVVPDSERAADMNGSPSQVNILDPKGGRLIGTHPGVDEASDVAAITPALDRIKQNGNLSRSQGAGAKASRSIAARPANETRWVHSDHPRPYRAVEKSTENSESPSPTQSPPRPARQVLLGLASGLRV